MGETIVYVLCASVFKFYWQVNGWDFLPDGNVLLVRTFMPHALSELEKLTLFHPRALMHQSSVVLITSSTSRLNNFHSRRNSLYSWEKPKAALPFRTPDPRSEKNQAQNDRAATNPTQNPSTCTVVSFQFPTGSIFPVNRRYAAVCSKNFQFKRF